MQMTFYFFVIVISAYQTQAYRYSIFPDGTPPLCNNLTCKGGKPHTACKKLTPSSRCRGFEILHRSGGVINTMILGHNGVRNKIAGDFGIANMNILHWSKALERMSDHFLMHCLAEKDVCDFLVKKEISIGHNYYFSKAPPGSRWVGRAVRSWYSELGYDIKRWDQFLEALNRNISFPSFIQLIWPNTEFLGCAGAKMFDGYMVTCYYHPAATNKMDVFHMGKTCSICPDDRSTCSRDFTKLCGLDIVHDSAGLLSMFTRTHVVCISLLLIFNLFNNILLI